MCVEASGKNEIMMMKSLNTERHSQPLRTADGRTQTVSEARKKISRKTARDKAVLVTPTQQRDRDKMRPGKGAEGNARRVEGARARFN